MKKRTILWIGIAVLLILALCLVLLLPGKPSSANSTAPSGTSAAQPATSAPSDAAQEETQPAAEATVAPTEESTTKPTEGASAPTESTSPSKENTPAPTEGSTTPPTGSNAGGTEATLPPAIPEDVPEQNGYTLEISTKAMTLEVGKPGRLIATYNGTVAVKWSSSDPSVATVLEEGTVWAKSVGTAYITASVGRLSQTCVVTVVEPAATDTLTISTKKDTKILVGDTLQIAYSYSGNKPLTWNVTDPTVLTVTQNGIVTAVGAGSASVKITDGTLTARVRIIVEKPIEYEAKATNIDYVWSNAPFESGMVKYAGDSMTYEVVVVPLKANGNIVVTSSNSNVVSATWKYNGTRNDITFSFKSAGTATITIASADGCVSKSYTVTVRGDYDCNPGSGQLTPEQYCNAAMQVAQATTGATPVSKHSYYRVMTISEADLTWSNARNLGRSLAHEFYDNSGRICITFVEINADGKYVFHIGY